jgi:hypothetical protein
LKNAEMDQLCHRITMTSIGTQARPYTVTYRDFHTGELKKVTRRPPPKLHDMLPTDQVQLTYKKNDDWLPGDEVRVKHISPKQPNILQVEKDDGSTTFVSHYDARLLEKLAPEHGESLMEDPKFNRYLLWP